MMRMTLIAAALTGLFAVPALAADAAPAAPAAPAPAYTITTNVNLTSDYYFRGITQTWHKPALQGGADFVHTNGLYAGVWASNVSNNSYPGGSALEFDYYGGYNGKINDDWGYTVGGHGYMYPGANNNKQAGNFPNAGAADIKYDTFEWNVGASWKFVSVKYSQQLTNWFGADKGTLAGPAGTGPDGALNTYLWNGNSKGSSYLEANVAYEFIPSWTLNLHAAQTKVKATASLNGTGPALKADYDDYLIGVTKAFDGGWSAQLAYVQAKYKNSDLYKNYASLANGDHLTDPGEGKVILTVGRTF